MTNEKKDKEILIEKVDEVISQIIQHRRVTMTEAYEILSSKLDISSRQLKNWASDQNTMVPPTFAAVIFQLRAIAEELAPQKLTVPIASQQQLVTLNMDSMMRMMFEMGTLCERLQTRIDQVEKICKVLETRERKREEIYRGEE